MSPGRWVRALALATLLVSLGCGRETGNCDPRYGDLLCMPGQVCDARQKRCLAGQACSSVTDCSDGFACDLERRICYRGCGKDVQDTFVTCPACCQSGYTCDEPTLTCRQN
jgi:hypothetical protein